MGGIEEMAKGLVKSYPFLSDEKKTCSSRNAPNLANAPRCGSPVYEGEKNYYCSNRECAFTMWKNDRFFEERKAISPRKSPPRSLKDGKATVKALFPKTGKTYEGTVLWLIRAGSMSHSPCGASEETKVTQRVWERGTFPVKSPPSLTGNDGMLLVGKCPKPSVK